MPNIKVNPEILVWARETAGLTLDEAAKKLQLKHSKDKTAADKLLLIEEGLQEPSRSMLLKMSKQYHRSLLSLYLDKPPQKSNKVHDFRVLPDVEIDNEEGLVTALVRDVLARQSILRAALEDEDEQIQIPIVASSSIDDGVTKCLDRIVKFIKFDLDTYRNQANIEQSFFYLRRIVEASGIYVLIIGDLGSHHTQIGVEKFRGFAIADPYVPFIVINDKDSRAAWSFTILHELTHILLGETGISGQIPESQIEKFCNDVASEALLPSQELDTLNVTNTTPLEESEVLINTFSSDRRISNSMVAYNLYKKNKIDYEIWFKLKTRFKDQWIQYKKDQSLLANSKNSNPSYYVVKKHRVGNALVDIVQNLINTGSLTYTKAGKVLGIKPRNVAEVFRI